ncbi:putative ripening-related protein 7 [Panicum hallii]|uniref:putative ripening-related protein 7 n=1 Tax=Panicum hallii TaxID=206008 RepID=UPI000DF4E678|nr:putative ripening-related protein 7 [Panicum hallii]
MIETKSTSPDRCAPPCSCSTPAVMTVNGFRSGESGGGPAACDGHFHSDGELIVALSTGWFAGGHRCHRAVRITSARTGRSVEARVVDECDSRRGCRGNIVDSSPAVWRALGLDTGVGEVPVTWSASRRLNAFTGAGRPAARQGTSWKWRRVQFVCY